MKHKSIKIRILQLTVMLIIVGFLVITLFSVRSLNTLISSNAQSLTSLLSSSIYDAVRNVISKPSIVGRTISYDSFLKSILNVDEQYPEDYMSERLGAYLSEIRSGIDYSTAFIISSKTRRFYGIDGTIRMLNSLNREENERYEQFISSGKSRMSAVLMDSLYTRQNTFFSFSRIKDSDGKVLGVVGVGVPLDTILHIIRDFEQQYNVKIFLVDWDEQVMLSTRSGQQHLGPLPASYRQNREFNYVQDEHGGYLITRYLDEIGWFLVIKGETTDGEKSFSGVMIVNVLAIIAVFGLLLAATQFLVGSGLAHFERRAATDGLTGIANRAGFETMLEQVFSNSTEGGTLFLLDLDHFKEVNDNLGHPTGDALLKSTASTLKNIFRESDIVARLGGDEFVVYAPSLNQREIIADKARTILKAIKTSYQLADGSMLTVTVSVGIALYPLNGDDYKTLYKNADTALYATKERGRNDFTIYTG
ncbi:MAG: GGDEF domain-containing protein [Desulfovibrio sp.]|nr:GGDEF domain-containing protein [Desulfovibrio sp.]